MRGEDKKNLPPQPYTALLLSYVDNQAIVSC